MNLGLLRNEIYRLQGETRHQNEWLHLFVQCRGDEVATEYVTFHSPFKHWMLAEAAISRIVERKPHNSFHFGLVRLYRILEIPLALAVPKGAQYPAIYMGVHRKRDGVLQMRKASSLSAVFEVDIEGQWWPTRRPPKGARRLRIAGKNPFESVKEVQGLTLFDYTGETAPVLAARWSTKFGVAVLGVKHNDVVSEKPIKWLAEAYGLSIAGALSSLGATHPQRRAQ